MAIELQAIEVWKALGEVRISNLDFQVRSSNPKPVVGFKNTNLTRASQRF